MRAMANTTPIVTTVTKPTTKEKTPKEADATPRIRRNKQKEVHARLDFEESPKKRRIREGSQNSSANPSERPKVRDRLRYNERHVLNRLGHRRQSAFDRLSDTYSPSTTKSEPDRPNSRDLSHSRSHPRRRDSSNGYRPRSRDRSCGIEESYDNTRSSYRTGTKHGYRGHGDHPRYEKRGGKVNPRHPAYQRAALAMGDTRSQGDPEDHVKIFQAAVQVERWAMPTWCHMFNSTLIGAARVWFDELPPESIDGYKDLKEAFLAYFMQQKKYVKDPVEIHSIKQRDGETIRGVYGTIQGGNRTHEGSLRVHADLRIHAWG
ncbi:reverse transcriptase domain-containing protein [Tanacetum coccineum]